MEEYKLNINDLMGVLHLGKVLDGPEYKNGNWRYQVETDRTVVMTAFQTPDFIRIIKTWRK